MTDSFNTELGLLALQSVTTTTADFIQPLLSISTPITVGSTTGLSVGQYIFIQNGGYYQIVSVDSATGLHVYNAGLPNNIAPTGLIPSGSFVTPEASGAVLGTVISKSYQGVITASSPTILVTSSTVLAANANRRYLFVQNIDSTASIAIIFGVPAFLGAPDMLLLPGAFYEFPASFMPTNEMHAIASAQTSNLVIWEGV